MNDQSETTQLDKLIKAQREHALLAELRKARAWLRDDVVDEGFALREHVQQSLAGVVTSKRSSQTAPARAASAFMNARQAGELQPAVPGERLTQS